MNIMHTLSVNIENKKILEQARRSRDSRFDGLFYVAVKTTGIYCRPICPAITPKESNIEYYQHAHLAAKAGYRPCLRCHPDSAPNSPIWNGVSTTLVRAKRLIDTGILEHGKVSSLSDRLGISDRYLRQLFDRHLGVSPKTYALFKQCEFAKNLLHDTTLPITEIAYASGFNSIRRFNDCFKKQLNLTPLQVRKNKKRTSNELTLKLYYRPPYNWYHLQNFFSHRLISGLEWTDKNSYGRTFTWEVRQNKETTKCKGWFTAFHNEKVHRFDVKITLDNVKLLKPVVNNIRRILDLDTDIITVEQSLASSCFDQIETGLRLPGTWSVFEAGIRAILGQQISVIAARKLVKLVVDNLGEETTDSTTWFPSIKSMANSNFDFLKIPSRRKQTLQQLSKYLITADESYSSPDNWSHIKGIGPWTIDYAKMRGESDPDIYLGGDLGITKALNKSFNKSKVTINPNDASPFRSYLTFQLWNLL